MSEYVFFCETHLAAKAKEKILTRAGFKPDGKMEFYPPCAIVADPESGTFHVADVNREFLGRIFRQELVPNALHHAIHALKNNAKPVTGHSDLHGKPEDGVKRKVTYPYYGIHRGHGLVVSVEEPGRCFIVHSAKTKNGLTKQKNLSFSEDDLEVLRGTVVLRNVFI